MLEEEGDDDDEEGRRDRVAVVYFVNPYLLLILYGLVLCVWCFMSLGRSIMIS